MPGYMPSKNLCALRGLGGEGFKAQTSKYTKSRTFGFGDFYYFAGYIVMCKIVNSK